MIELNSIKEIKIYSKSLSEIKKINLEKIGLYKVNEPNIFEYKSSIFKILNYKIHSVIKFLITFSEGKINIELLSIKGMPYLLKESVVIEIKVNIYQEANICKAERFLSLSLKKESLLMKLIPDEILRNLFLKALESISSRFDKKLLNKLINA